MVLVGGLWNGWEVDCAEAEFGQKGGSEVTITRDMATALAREQIELLQWDAGCALSMRPELTTDTANGWVFFYNSEEFIATQVPSAALAGNGPIFINHDGEVHLLGTQLGWEEQVATL